MKKIEKLEDLQVKSFETTTRSKGGNDLTTFYCESIQYCYTIDETDCRGRGFCEIYQNESQMCWYLYNNR